MPAPDAELPIPVLTELGRVTWAAIRLEDTVEGICDVIRPTNPREDRRPLGRKVDDALADLAAWENADAAERIKSWLLTADGAIRRRNATFHAVPMEWVPIGEPASPPPPRFWLGEMPRRAKGRHPAAEYVERPMSVETLSELADLIERAIDGWMELTLLADAVRRA